MTANPDYHIDDVDIFRFSFIHLASHIPHYIDRAGAYLQTIFDENPQVVIIQGLSPTEYTLMGGLQSNGTLITGDYKKTMSEKSPSVNATWVAQNIRVVEQRTIRISEIANNDVEHILAPDCVVVTINYRGRIMDIYNMESVSGVFNETARMHALAIMNRDAYLTKTRRKGHFDSLLIMAGNMYAEPGARSIRYLEGYETVKGTAPSGWRDVWDELRMTTSPDRAATQRLETNAMFNEDIVYPQFMRAKRMSYFMVYNDVFGRIGTPISIDRNGADFTDDGVPLSDTYGLDMQIYLPMFNKFITR